MEDYLRCQIAPPPLVKYRQNQIPLYAVYIGYLYMCTVSWSPLYIVYLWIPLYVTRSLHTFIC